jgi:hypothetical protein
MRRGGWSAERQRAFIEALAETGSVRSACRALGVGEHHIYKLRQHPEAASFRAAWEAALDLGIQRIEDVAMDRALNGVEVEVFHGGQQVGTRRTYNDRLLMFMLQSRAPERFGGSRQPRSGRLDAIGKMEKRRLKKKWRAQWEKELRRVSPAEVRASIDRKIEAVRMAIERERAQEWAKLSEETRAAWERFVTLRDRDFAALEVDEATRRRLERGPRQLVNAVPPVKTEPVVVEESWPKWRKITDEGWDK